MLLITFFKEWKDEYINSWISLSGVLCGTAYSLIVDVPGTKEYFPWIDPHVFRDVGRTFGGLTWYVFPQDNVTLSGCHHQLTTGGMEEYLFPCQIGITLPLTLATFFLQCAYQTNFSNYNIFRCLERM